MTADSPEVVAWYTPPTIDTLPVVALNGRSPRGEPLIRLADYQRLQADHERLQAECEALRTCLAETAGVAVTMLYDSHRQDTLKEFDVTELSRMVDYTKHLAGANVQVEKVYRKAWDMTQRCAGADWGGYQ